MRIAVTLIMVLLLCLSAVAQINPPLPQNITEVGPIHYLGADGSMEFAARTVEGRIRMPAGIYAWSAAPFRYRAYFTSGDADTIGALLAPVPVDTAMSDVRGDVQYPVELVLPGAKWLSVDLGDTVWARAYYTD